MLGLSVTEGETDLSRARELYAHLLEKYLEAAVSAMEPRAFASTTPISVITA